MAVILDSARDSMMDDWFKNNAIIIALAST